MGNLDVNEILDQIMKSSVNMEHTSGMVIRACGGMVVYVSV